MTMTTDTPKADDLPVGTVVATADLVGIRVDREPRYGGPWNMSNGGHYGGWKVDEMLADGAQVLRVGTGNPVIEHLDPEESTRATLALLGVEDTEENRAKLAAIPAKVRAIMDLRPAVREALTTDPRNAPVLVVDEGSALGLLARGIDLGALLRMGRKNSLALSPMSPEERRALYRQVMECTCVENCAEDPRTACSLSGIPHVHPDDGSGTFGPCPVHPDRPGDH
jgi:hypothetical protein